MPDWPSDLDFFGSADTEIALTQDHLVRYPVSVGPPIVRRRTRIQRSVVRAKSMPLTEAQKDQLLDFYNDDLDGGVHSFRRYNLIVGRMMDYRFVSDLEVRKIGTDLFQIRTTLEAF